MRDDEAVARFYQDACLITRLEHLHILPVYDSDGAQVPLCIVMRYLGDGTILDMLAGGPLRVTDIAFRVQQVGQALHYTHRQWTITRSKGIARSPCERAVTTE